MKFRGYTVLFLFAFVSACSGGSDSNDSEAIIQEDDSVDAGIESEPTPTPEPEDPNSRENLAALRAMTYSRITYRCQPYLTEAAEGRSWTFNPNKQFGNSYPTGDDLFYVDELGEPTIDNGLHTYSVYREEFGDQHLLVQCINSKYGVLRAFIPKIGSVGQGLASEYANPPYLGVTGGGSNFGSDAFLWISARSELEYRVYMLLAAKEVEDNGISVNLIDVDVIYKQAKELVSSIRGFNFENIVNNQYMIDPGDRDARRNKFQATYNEIAGINEQARLISERVFGFDGDPGKVLQEVANQLVSKRQSLNYGDIVYASYFADGIDLVSIDPGFADIESNWVEYRNTGAQHGFSESFIFVRENGQNDFRIQFESNVENGLESLQHGIYQEFAVSGKDLNTLYLKATYKQLDGIFEEPGNFSTPVDSGIAAIAIEYLDGNNESLGSTIFGNYESGVFANSPFSGSPVPFQTVGTMSVTRVPGVGNNGMALNVGLEAKRALGDESINKIATIRFYAFAADFLSEQVITHWSGAFPTTPTCRRCSADLTVNYIGLHEIQ